MQITRGRYNTKLFLTLTPAGADSDLNAMTTAPSQAEVTDLNCSDHSTTSIIIIIIIKIIIIMLDKAKGELIIGKVATETIKKEATLLEDTT